MTNYTAEFETARQAYPGTKRGCETELKYFRKTHKDWRQVISLLLPAIEKQKSYWQKEGTQTRFMPHFKTWIYNRHWELELASETKEKRSVELEQKILMRKRKEKYEDLKPYFANKSTSELNEMLYEPGYTCEWWIIKKILGEREDKRHKGVIISVQAEKELK